MTDADGDTAAERRYLPWGEERYVDAEVPTDRLYGRKPAGPSTYGVSA